jgi:hypothetical protein
MTALVVIACITAPVLLAAFYVWLYALTMFRRPIKRTPEWYDEAERVSDRVLAEMDRE